MEEITTEQRPGILIADDEEPLQRFMCRLLARNGYKTAGVRDGVEAWEALQNDPLPALVVLDVMMPRMDGYELMQRMQNDLVLRPVPFLMLTARPSDPDAFRGWFGLREGHYLAKPFSAEALLQAVRRLIG